MKKKILFSFRLFMLALLLAGSAFKLSAEVYPDHIVIDGIGYYIGWSEDDDGYVPLFAIVGWHETEISGNLVIPSTIYISYENWYDSSCFATIPVVIIDSGAFWNCTGITSLSIGDNVTDIGSSAFEGCTGITSVTVGKSVKTIENYAFYFGTPEYKVIIDENTGDEIFIDEMAYFKNEEGYYYTCNDYAHYDYHSNLKELTWNAQHCESYGNMITSTIEKITIGDGVEILPEFFATDSKITEITIPNSVETIGNGAFMGCNNLMSLEIPSSVNEVGDNALNTDSHYICSIYDEEIEDYKEGRYYINGSSCNTREFIWNALCEFKGGIAPTVEKVTIGEGVEILSPYFAAGTKITEIDIPNSVTTIGNSAFSRCTGLTNIEIPDAVTTIDNSAFYGCTDLSILSIGKSVSSIRSQAFKDCSALKELIWNAKECWSRGDMTTSSIEKVTIGNEVELLPEGFVRGSKITEVTIPESVDYIGNYAFYDCPNLETVFWNAMDGGHYYNADSDENSYTFHPFSNCSKIIFGKDVESIHLSVLGRWLDTIFGGMFYCGSDTVISHAIVPPTISMPILTEMDYGLDRYFFDNYENAVLFVPKGSIESYRSADYWKKFVAIKELEDTPSICGDVDGDNKVSISDVTTLINYLLSGNPTGLNIDNADVDGSGRISIDDVTTLINYLLSGQW